MASWPRCLGAEHSPEALPSWGRGLGSRMATQVTQAVSCLGVQAVSCLGVSGSDVMGVAGALAGTFTGVLGAQ